MIFRWHELLVVVQLLTLQLLESGLLLITSSAWQAWRARDGQLWPRPMRSLRHWGADGLGDTCLQLLNCSSSRETRSRASYTSSHEHCRSATSLAVSCPPRPTGTGPSLEWGDEGQEEGQEAEEDELEQDGVSGGT